MDITDKMMAVSKWKLKSGSRHFFQDGRHLAEVNHRIDVVLDIHRGRRCMILVSIIVFLGRPDAVVTQEDTLDIALWVNPRWPLFVQGQIFHLYNFRQNLRRFINLVSILGFLGTPDTVMRPGNTLDIVLLVKSKMTAICSRSNM